MDIIGGTALWSAISATATFIVAKLTLIFAGFSAAGPVAGSAAAAAQASIGNVATGSLFATAQAAGMGGAAALATPVVVAAVAGGATYLVVT